MRIKPKKWTHHHTQRLYHISMLASFVFINFAIIYGIFAVLLQVNAGQLLERGSVNVTAIVPGIEAGTTVVEPPLSGGGDAVAYNPPTIPITEQEQLNAQLPQVIISVPEDIPVKPVKLPDGHTADLPSYSTQNPTFQGTTGIKNAIIFLEVHSFEFIRATTYADSNGHWSWAASEAVSPGLHRLFITAQDPQEPAIIAKSQLDFYVEPTALAKPNPAYNQNLISLPAIKEGNLFDVLLQIPQQFRTIAPGDDLVANIKLINFGSAGNPVDVGIQYTVENAQGEIIMQSSQTVAVATQSSILKTFNTNPSLPEGRYKLTVRVPSKDVVATAADIFEVKGSPVLAVGVAGKVDMTLIYQVLFALLFMFTLIAYYEYNKVSVLTHFIKKIDEKNIRLYNR